MKKSYFLLVLLPLFFFSCDEGCDKTIAPQIKNSIRARVLILDQNGNGVLNYPVKIEFQKKWCDGSWAILVSNSGNTWPESVGYWDAVSPSYELNNKEDYILIKYTAGTGDNIQESSEKATYADFKSTVPTLYVEKAHTFEIIR